jgi:hypothetical protein
MRLRWIAIAVVSLFSIIGVYAVCRQQGGPVDSLVGMCQRILGGMLFALGFWGASHVLRHWMSQPIAQSVRVNGSTQSPPPMPPLPTYAIAPAEGECRYRVRGFDRETKFETIEFVYADSPSNAQVKVELKGVEVAAVERA